MHGNWGTIVSDSISRLRRSLLVVAQVDQVGRMGWQAVDEGGQRDCVKESGVLNGQIELLLPVGGCSW